MDESLKNHTKMIKETENKLLLAHEIAVETKKELLQKLEKTETEKQDLKAQLVEKLQDVHEAYDSLTNINSELELENATLRMEIEDKTIISSQLRDSYEGLLKGYNMLLTDLNTVKGEQAKDAEEFKNLLKTQSEDNFREIEKN
ncbi:hypothetical protein NQ317_017242 [Molorchus minor]|uniref:Uncharacterized protein n=1 Tax=Molorchus minor TaxID=1323400 RepID=A0ABQ9J1A5_9CUCU|nr:hypothetical protein NQ317_017242 [Molorchus minor]